MQIDTNEIISIEDLKNIDDLSKDISDNEVDKYVIFENNKPSMVLIDYEKFNNLFNMYGSLLSENENNVVDETIYDKIEPINIDNYKNLFMYTKFLKQN